MHVFYMPVVANSEWYAQEQNAESSSVISKHAWVQEQFTNDACLCAEMFV